MAGMVVTMAHTLRTKLLVLGQEMKSLLSTLCHNILLIHCAVTLFGDHNIVATVVMHLSAIFDSHVIHVGMMKMMMVP